MLPVYHWKRVKVGDWASTLGTRSSLTRLYKRILHRTRFLKTSSTETHPILMESGFYQRPEGRLRLSYSDQEDHRNGYM